MIAAESISQKAILELEHSDNMDYERFVVQDGQGEFLSKVASKLNTNSGNIITGNNITSNKITRNQQSALDGPQSGKLKESILEVQYNPASIKYSASTSEQEKTDKKKPGQKMIVSTSRVDMSFDLVFHSTYTGDQSVREQMDLVMNVLCSSPTRQARFTWSDTQFCGKLVSFSGEYDMFDASGTPVSGHMSITLQSESKISWEKKALDNADKERSDKKAVKNDENKV